MTLVGAVACGDPSNGLTSGYVLNREHTSGSTTIHSHPITSQQCRTTTTVVNRRPQSRTSCRTVTTGYFPHAHRIPATWRLQVEQERPCPRDKNGVEKCKVGWLNVDERDFDRYPPGSHYPDAR